MNGLETPGTLTLQSTGSYAPRDAETVLSEQHSTVTRITRKALAYRVDRDCSACQTSVAVVVRVGVDMGLLVGSFLLPNPLWYSNAPAAVTDLFPVKLHAISCASSLMSDGIQILPRWLLEHKQVQELPAENRPEALQTIRQLSADLRDPELGFSPQEQDQLRELRGRVRRVTYAPLGRHGMVIFAIVLDNGIKLSLAILVPRLIRHYVDEPQSMWAVYLAIFGSAVGKLFVDAPAVWRIGKDSFRCCQARKGKGYALVAGQDFTE